MQKDSFFNYSVCHDLYIEASDISELFKNYGEIYMKTFSLKLSELHKIKNWKENKGGILISIIKNNSVVACFTLTNGENNFFELGDIFKIKFKIKRNLLSKALKIGCEEAMIFFKKDGVYGYPNKHALKLELEAGFKIYCLYRRKIYLTFLGLKLLLPFYIYSEKINLDLSVYKNHSILTALKNKLHKTKIVKFRLLNVFCFTKKKNVFFDFLNFGFIYNFEIFPEKGEPFIIFGNSYYPISKIDFQFSDNSI